MTRNVTPLILIDSSSGFSSLPKRTSRTRDADHADLAPLVEVELVEEAPGQ
jgi:hypothetical protein